jgi:hypothetical protein
MQNELHVPVKRHDQWPSNSLFIKDSVEFVGLVLELIPLCFFVIRQ